MFEFLKADLRRNLKDYEPCSAVKRWALLLTLNTVHALVLIRFQLWCSRHKLPTIFASKLLFWFFKIEINKNVTIGPGLRLPHPMGILIGPNAVVGPNCDIYADVRLVLSKGIKEGPVLAEGVFMGDGSKALGPIHIGEYSVIGASAVVTKDIPARVTAAGVPARVLSENIVRS
jgi:serine O-acetyltransferase